MMTEGASTDTGRGVVPWQVLSSLGQTYDGRGGFLLEVLAIRKNHKR